MAEEEENEHLLQQIDRVTPVDDMLELLEEEEDGDDDLRQPLEDDDDDGDVDGDGSVDLDVTDEDDGNNREPLAEDTDGGEDDEDDLYVPEPDDQTVTDLFMKKRMEDNTRRLDMLLKQNEQQRVARNRAASSSMEAEEVDVEETKASVVIDTRVRCGIKRVLPGMPAVSMGAENRPYQDGAYTKVISWYLLNMARQVQEQHRNDPASYKGESMPHAMCLTIYVPDGSNCLLSDLLFKRAGHPAETASVPIKIATYFLMTILFSAWKLVIQDANYLPNIVMQVIGDNNGKVLTGNVGVRIMSVFTSTNVRSSSALDHLATLLQEHINDNGKAVDAQAAARIICRRIRSFICRPSQIILLYHDLAMYLRGEMPRRAFPAIDNEHVRREMMGNDVLRYYIFGIFHPIFHSSRAPPVMGLRYEGRALKPYVVDASETAIDIGDGNVFYPFRDILPHHEGERSTTHPDIIAEGMMHIATNMNVEDEAPSSIGHAMRSATGENVNMMQLWIDSVSMPVAGAEKTVADNSMLLDRIFDPDVNARNFLRICKPPGSTTENNSGTLEFFFRETEQMVNTGENLVPHKLQDLVNACDEDIGPMRLMAAPSMIVEDSFREEIDSDDILHDRFMFGEQEIRNMNPVLRRRAVGPASTISPLFSINPLQVGAHELLVGMRIYPVALTNRKAIQSGMSAFKRELLQNYNLPAEERIPSCQRVFVRVVRATDESHMFNGGNDDINVWPENTASHLLFARQSAVVRGMRGRARNLTPIVGRTPEQLVPGASLNGDFSTPAGMPLPQMDLAMLMFNKAEPHQIQDNADAVVRDIKTALGFLWNTWGKRMNDDSPVTSMNKFFHYVRRIGDHSMVCETLPVTPRNIKSDAESLYPVSVNRPMLMGSAGTGSDNFTNKMSSDLSVLGEFVARVAYELREVVGVQSISGILSTYVLSVLLTMVREIPSCVHVLLLGDTTTGKTLFLSILQNIAEPMGLFETADRVTHAASYTGDDRSRHCVQARNEIDPTCLVKAVAFGGDRARGDMAGGDSTSDANHEGKQRALLNFVENPVAIDRLKQSVETKKNGAPSSSSKSRISQSNFVSKDRTTNTQCAFVATSNLNLSQIANTILARFFTISLRGIKRDADAPARPTRIASCGFTDVLRHLMLGNHEMSMLTAVERIFLPVDTSVVSGILTQAHKEHLRLAQQAGCAKAFRIDASDSGGGSGFKADRYLDMMIQYMSSLCISRLLLTIQSLSPVLGTLDSFTKEVMYGLVSVLAVANEDDMIHASAITSNIDMTCETERIQDGCRVVKENLIQAFLYCLEHDALRLKYGDKATWPGIDTGRQSRRFSSSIRSPLSFVSNPEMIRELRESDMRVIDDPDYAWIWGCTIKWYSGKHVKHLISALSQKVSYPLTTERLDPTHVPAEIGLAFWSLASKTTRLVKKLWNKFDKHLFPSRQVRPNVDRGIKRKAPSVAASSSSSSSSEVRDGDEFDLQELQRIEEKSRKMTPRAFGDFVKSKIEDGDKMIVMPRLGYSVLVPTAVVGHKDITPAIRTDTMPYDGDNVEILKAVICALDPTHFFDACVKTAEHLHIKRRVKPSARHAQQQPPPPPQQSPLRDEKKAGSSSSQKGTKVIEKSYGSTPSLRMQLQAQATLSAATEHIDIDQSGNRGSGAASSSLSGAKWDAVDKQDPQYLATLCDSAFGKKIKSALLVNAGVIRVSAMVNETTHAVICTESLDATASPLMQAWKNVHASISEGKLQPNVFCTGCSMVVPNVGDNDKILRLPAIKLNDVQSKTQSYVDQGTALLLNIQDTMEKFQHGTLDEDEVTPFPRHGVVMQTDGNTVYDVAIKARMSCGLMWAGVAPKLRDAAVEYRRQRGLYSSNPKTEREACRDFVNDLIRALVYCPKEFMKKYQHLDESKLKPFPEFLAQGQQASHRRVCKGTDFVDVSLFKEMDISRQRSATISGQKYRRAMKEARIAARHTSGATGKLINAWNRNQFKNKNRWTTTDGSAALNTDAGQQPHGEEAEDDDDAAHVDFDSDGESIL
jgi:hypothetical protein